MQRLCRSCGDWHSLDELWPSACASHFAVRSDGGTMKRPMVISDTLDGVQSMISGERFDSKANLRRHYRANDATEVGNDIAATLKYAAQKPARPKITKGEIHQAIAKIKRGYRPNLPAD